MFKSLCRALLLLTLVMRPALAQQFTQLNVPGGGPGQASRAPDIGNVTFPFLLNGTLSTPLPPAARSTFFGQSYVNGGVINVIDTAANATGGSPKNNGLLVYDTFGGGEANRNAFFSVLDYVGPQPGNTGPFHFYTSDFSYMAQRANEANGDFFGIGCLYENFGFSAHGGKCAEFDTANKAGSTVANSLTVTIDLVNQHASPGVKQDAALAFGADSSIKAKWRNGIQFTDSLGISPWDTTSTLIWGGPLVIHAKRLMDFTGDTCSDDCFYFPGLNITANGDLKLSSNLPFASFNNSSGACTTSDLWRLTALGGGHGAALQINTAAGCDFSTVVTPLQWNATGVLSVPSIPAAAGAGGLYVCADASGALYRKATCP